MPGLGVRDLHEGDDLVGADRDVVDESFHHLSNSPIAANYVGPALRVVTEQAGGFHRPDTSAPLCR